MSGWPLNQQLRRNIAEAIRACKMAESKSAKGFPFLTLLVGGLAGKNTICEAAIFFCYKDHWMPGLSTDVLMRYAYSGRARDCPVFSGR